MSAEVLDQLKTLKTFYLDPVKDEISNNTPISALYNLVNVISDRNAGYLNTPLRLDEQKRLARLLFSALIEDYEKQLQEKATTVEDEKLAYFKQRPIPNNLNNFVFIMLVLNYFLRDGPGSDAVGPQICDEIDRFFKKYTEYLPEYDDVFEEISDYKKKQLQRLKNRQINLKTDLVNYIVQGVQKITPKIVQELRRNGQQLKQMIRTPKELQHLTYDQVETLLKWDLGLLNGNKNIDQETQKLRDTWEKIQQKDLFKKMRRRYVAIQTELDQLENVLAQKWDTMWSDYRKQQSMMGPAEQTSGDFCVKLKNLIKQYADLIYSIYVHGRIKQVFPELKIDLRAYEKIFGQPEQKEYEEFEQEFGDLTEAFTGGSRRRW